MSGQKKWFHIFITTHPKWETEFVVFLWIPTSVWEVFIKYNKNAMTKYKISFQFENSYENSIFRSTMIHFWSLFFEET